MIRKSIIFLILIVFLCNFSITKEKFTSIHTRFQFLDIPILEVEENIATLVIPKIHLEEALYDKNSPHNTINEHVTILKESSDLDDENGAIFLAAHSGIGDIAYFNDLDQLERGDVVSLIQNDRIETFEVVIKQIQIKSGSIQVPRRNQKMLILTTCMPRQKGKQLVIVTEKKESA